jgi:hypothetical protein
MYIHLWFLGHLLLYSVGYVVWRLLTDGASDRSRETWPIPTGTGIAAFVVALGVVTWAQLMLDGGFPVDGDTSSTDIPYTTGRTLGRVLRAPLIAGGVAPEDMSDREFVEFTTSTCQGLRRWPRANRSMREVPAASEEDEDV